MYKRAIGATECPFDSGGGVQWLFGQCPNEQLYFFGGASLREGCKKIYTTLSIFRHAIKVNIALVPV